MSDKDTEVVSNVETEYLFSWYGKFPNLLKWTVFLPTAAILAILLLLPISLIKENIKPGFLYSSLRVLHSPLVQFYFLVFLKYLIPKNRKKIITIVIILRSLLLLAFIAQPILTLMGVTMPYDSVYFTEFLGEILVLVMSLKLLKEFENVTLLFCRNLLKYTFYTYLWLVAWLLFEATLDFLSKIPIIGGLFRYLKHLRNTVY